MMGAMIGRSLRHRAGAFPGMVRRRLPACLEPATSTSAGGALGDPARATAEPVTENALLRQQPIVLRRLVKRPAPTPTGRPRPAPRSPH